MQQSVVHDGSLRIAITVAVGIIARLLMWKKTILSIYIKADPKVTNPKHVMSCAVLDGVSSRVHIYVKEKENHTLEVISVKPY